MTTNLASIILNADQDNALNNFVDFLCDPMETVFVLQGYSGTGKSTLIRTLLSRLDNYISAAKLIDASYPDYALALTATTNKAADTFSKITGMAVSTIHSFLELMLHSDYKTGEKTLVPKRGATVKENYLLFIDEASFIDKDLLKTIFEQTKNCKIVFIGDPAQLLMPKAFSAPVFSAGFKGAMLSQVMRQLVNGVPQVNPISDLATAFRHTVNGGPWPQFKPDGHFVEYIPDRKTFGDRVMAEFARPDWEYHDSKVLAYTNACVIAYNNHIRGHIQGDPKIQVGDYVECNSFVTNGGKSVKTDQLVYVTEIEDDTQSHGVDGNFVQLDYTARFFFPKDRKAKQKRLLQARADGNYKQVQEIENWIDLRAVFAQTVNKSQGSTYNTVFIDLDNIGTCNNPNQLARMMYVGTSRASTKLILTGDLV